MFPLSDFVHVFGVDFSFSYLKFECFQKVACKIKGVAMLPCQLPKNWLTWTLPENRHFVTVRLPTQREKVYYWEKLGAKLAILIRLSYWDCANFRCRITLYDEKNIFLILCDISFIMWETDLNLNFSHENCKLSNPSKATLLYNLSSSHIGIFLRYKYVYGYTSRLPKNGNQYEKSGTWKLG